MRDCISRVTGFSCFFFSSRRRHTRSLCDWSSDVCSSDLARPAQGAANWLPTPHGRFYLIDRKSTRLNSSHTVISYAVFCLKKKKKKRSNTISLTLSNRKLLRRITRTGNILTHKYTRNQYA